MKQNFLVLTFFVFIILTAGTLYAINAENVGDWWGKVTINGDSGNNGAIVDAYIDGNKVVSAIVGEYEKDFYLIHVEGQNGDNVLFKVNGVDAMTKDWSNGDHRLDLSVTIQESSPPSSSPSSGGSSKEDGESSLGSTTNTQTNDTINSNSKTEDKESINLNSSENRETGPGITGRVVSFVKTGKGLGLIVISLIIGAGVIGIKYKPLRKWKKKS